MTSRISSLTRSLSLADSIREFVFRNYIEPARKRRECTLVIRARDVHKKMGLVNRMPAVCGALSTRKFQDTCKVQLVERQGPIEGASTTFKFKLWLIQYHGDYFERLYWPSLCKSFPNYETLWQEFVVPLTRRPHSITLRQNIDEVLEDMCMAHYSVFYHLGRARELSTVDGLLFAHPEDVFFHLSAATEMVNRFLWATAKISDQVGDHGSLIAEYSEQQFKKKAAQAWEGYKQDFCKLMERGKSVSFPLNDVGQIARGFCEHKGDALSQSYKTWSEKARRVREYRNSFAHNPLLARLLDANRASVPREPSRFYRWSHVIYPDGQDISTLREHERKAFGEKFVDLGKLVEECQQGLEQATNALWDLVIESFRYLSTEPNYQGMARQEIQETSVASQRFSLAPGFIDDIRPRSIAGTVPEESYSTPRLASGSACLDWESDDLGSLARIEWDTDNLPGSTCVDWESEDP